MMKQILNSIAAHVMRKSDDCDAPRAMVQFKTMDAPMFLFDRVRRIFGSLPLVDSHWSGNVVQDKGSPTYRYCTWYLGSWSAAYLELQVIRVPGIR
jgi:hypothetical protein